MRRQRRLKEGILLERLPFSSTMSLKLESNGRQLSKAAPTTTIVRRLANSLKQILLVSIDCLLGGLVVVVGIVDTGATTHCYSSSSCRWDSTQIR